jgi:hypothetical protein
VGCPPTDTVVPLGTDTVALAPGTDTDALPLGTDAEALAPGTDTDALPFGTDTVALEPGSDTDALPPGTDTDTPPPGTLSVAVPPGADTVTGPDPVPGEGLPGWPPLCGEPCWAACEPPVVPWACCWGVVEPVAPAAAGGPPTALDPWPAAAGVEKPARRVTLVSAAVGAVRPPCCLEVFAWPSARGPR